MNRLARCFWLALLLPAAGLAAGPAADLPKLEVKLSDTRALQSGAQLFVNYCLSCHSAEYMRYQRLADDLHIPPELAEENLLFADTKIGDTLQNAMSRADGDIWFGIAPPDLTLVGRLRGADWLYAYLRGFYWDPATGSGWNNTLIENVAMPHVLYEMQGIYRKTEAGDLEQVRAGRLSPEEFDRAMSDLTHFLVYMAEPARLVRVKYGVWTLLFIALFGFVAYLLKREYWRDLTSGSKP